MIVLLMLPLKEHAKEEQLKSQKIQDSTEDPAEAGSFLFNKDK
jgi:hypothetical protein